MAEEKEIKKDNKKQEVKKNSSKDVKEVKASARFIRIAPRKVRLVVSQIRGAMVADALGQLRFINKKSVDPITKLLNSAIANAKNNFSLSEKDLYIKKIIVNDGPVLARFRPRAHGRAGKIRKRMSHIELSLAIKESKVEDKKSSVKKKEQQKTVTPQKKTKRSAKTN